MPMVGWICRPETSVSRVFEDFTIGVILLFGLYGPDGISTATTRSADRDGC